MFFNMDQERFHDRRVRKAIWLMGDFPWGSKRSYGFFAHATSFFHGSELASRDLPSALELTYLDPLRSHGPDHLPPSVFTQPYKPQPNTGTGYVRENAIAAAALLAEAGWHVVDGRLRHKETGEPFHLRFLAVSAALGRGFISFTKRLERLGITSEIAAPELSNWQYRIRAGDFGVSAIWFLPESTPTQLVSNQFLSVGADQAYSYNWANIRNPVLDALILGMQQAKTYEQFVAATRALDRVLLHNYYFLPSSSRVDQNYVFWDKFGHPDVTERLSRQAQLMTWWYDDAKAAEVLAFVGIR